MAGTEKGKLPNYLDDHGRLEKTLKSFTESSGSLKYVDMLQAIADRKKQVFELSLDDLHSVMENELADRIQSNTMGYMDQISKLIDENMPQPSPDADFEKDTLDVLNEDREIGADGDEGLMRSLPPAMHRRYQLVIVHDGQKRLPLRQLRADAASWSPYKGSLQLQQPEEVPKGSIPRSIKAIAEDNTTGQATPGDVVNVTGVYLPESAHGFKALSASTVTNVYFHALKIEQNKKSYAEYTSSEKLQQQVEQLYESGDVYEQLSQSIAPEIWGHNDVKKVLLLLLVGAGTKSLSDVTIRGDINVCLMGDPGVAKSQMLKWISTLVPRAIYTTGKGSSGVGLTAAVTKDPYTGEALLEAGALVLADNGVCCIDEFDKMEEAGIVTSLNARVSVLAASNPLYGSWNRRKTVQENINLPTSLLSRFDILWLLLDEPDVDNDRTLASFVARNHLITRDSELMVSRQERNVVEMNVIRAAIGQAKELFPTVPEELSNHIARMYVEMRAAKARLRLAKTISEEDVDEAVRLMGQSKQSLIDAQEKMQKDPGTRWDKYPFQIYEIIKEHRDKTGNNTVKIDAVRQQLKMKGFKEDQIRETLSTYEAVNVWMVGHDFSDVHFVDEK